jgi:flagellar hook protein FlgE
MTADTKQISMVGYDKLGNTVQYDFYFTKTAVTTPPPATPDPASDVGRHGLPSRRCGRAAAHRSHIRAQLSAAVRWNSMRGQAGQRRFADDHGSSHHRRDRHGSVGLHPARIRFAGKGTPNGQAASPVDSVTIGKDGTVSAMYADGTSKALYRIPLATVASPDNLTLMSGNVYSANGTSGVTVTGFPQTNGFGTIQSGAIESSNVDLAGELTEMIESQRSYTANSKVFQTGSDIMDVLVNLKR